MININEIVIYPCFDELKVKDKLLLFGAKALESLEAIPLYFSFSRAFFPEYDVKNAAQNKPFCSSVDGKMPHFGTKKLPGPCEKCQNSVWQKNGKPPACRESYNIFFFSELGIGRVQCRGLGVREFRKLVFNMSIVFQENFCKTTIVPKQSEEDDIYVPSFSFPVSIGEEKKEILTRASQSLMAWDKKRCEKELSETGAEDEPESAQKPEQVDWMDRPVGFAKTGDLSWLDLAMDKKLPDGTKGRQYLHKLSGWKDNPEISCKAQFVLENWVEYLNSEEKKDDLNPPF